jgi:hypothetical protein
MWLICNKVVPAPTRLEVEARKEHVFNLEIFLMAGWQGKEVLRCG